MSLAFTGSLGLRDKWDLLEMTHDIMSGGDWKEVSYMKFEMFQKGSEVKKYRKEREWRTFSKYM